MVRLPLCLLALLAVGSLSATAAAQGKARPAAEADAPKAKPKAAKKIEKQGKKAYKKKRYDEAIQAFKMAYELNPLAKYHYNVARCYEKKGEFLEAIGWFQRYLLEEPEAEDRPVVESTIGLLRSKLSMIKAELKLLSQPPGATFTLIGKAGSKEGKTPYTAWLAFGSYELVVRMEGYLEDKRSLKLEKGKPAHIEISLQEDKPAEAKPEPQPPPKAEAKPPAQPETAAPSPPPPQTSFIPSARMVGFGAAGVGLLLFLGGASNITAHSSGDAYERTDGRVCGNQGDYFLCEPKTSHNLAFGLGFAMLAGGLVEAIFDPLGLDEELGAALLPTSGGAAVVLTGRY